MHTSSNLEFIIGFIFQIYSYRELISNWEGIYTKFLYKETFFNFLFLLLLKKKTVYVYSLVQETT